MVRFALTPDADQRPLPSVLLQDVQAARQAYVEKLQAGLRNRATVQSSGPAPPASAAQADFDRLQRPESWEDATRLYFRGNEINDMPVGVAPFPQNWAECEDYHLDSWADPDWPQLRMPIFPDAELPPQPIVPDEVVNQTVQELWDGSKFVDWPTAPDQFLKPLRVLLQMAEKIPKPSLPRREQDYATMSMLDVMNAISQHPKTSKEATDKIIAEGAGMDGLLETLRKLDGNPQQKKPLPTEDEYQRHYVATLKEELVERTGEDGKKFNTLNKSKVISRLMQLDQDPKTRHGTWRKKKQIPAKNVKRKRDPSDVDGTNGGGAAAIEAGGPTAARVTQTTSTIAEEIIARRAAGGRRSR